MDAGSSETRPDCLARGTDPDRVLLSPKPTILPSTDGVAQGPSSRSNDVSDPAESNWREVQQQIKDVLAAGWAQKLIDHETPSNGTNRDRLRRFAGLFQRPALENILKEEFENYKPRKPSDHPFVAFLSRFPERIPALPGGDADLTPSQAMQYLNSLDQKLKESKPFGIDLDLDNPETLADKARINLSYRDFFQVWWKDIPADVPSRGKWEKNGPLDQMDQSRDDDPAYRWVKPIRNLIVTRYIDP